MIFATFDGVDGSSLRAELRPKGRGRPQRILTGSWPEEHVHGVIRAVVFRDPSSLPRHMDREDASKLTANRNSSSASASSSSASSAAAAAAAAAAAMSRILNVNSQPANIQVLSQRHLLAVAVVTTRWKTKANWWPWSAPSVDTKMTPIWHKKDR